MSDMLYQTSVNKINATPGTRVWSFVIDVLAALFVGILIGVFGGNDQYFYPMSGSVLQNIAYTLSLFLTVALTVVQLVLVYRRSQTLGQYFVNVQVVDWETEKRVGFWNYLILWRFVGRTLVIGALPILDLLILPVYTLVDCLFILGRERRALHDRIAGARVVYLPENEKRKALIDFRAI